MRDRRFELRHDTNESVELHWTDPSGTVVACPAVIRDLSPSGARIALDRPIRLQTNLRITFRHQDLIAKVRTCNRTRKGFILGIELDTASRGLLTTRRSAQPLSA